MINTYRDIGADDEQVIAVAWHPDDRRPVVPATFETRFRGADRSHGVQFTDGRTGESVVGSADDVFGLTRIDAHGVHEAFMVCTSQRSDRIAARAPVSGGPKRWTPRSSTIGPTRCDARPSKPQRLTWRSAIRCQLMLWATRSRPRAFRPQVLPRGRKGARLLHSGDLLNPLTAETQLLADIIEGSATAQLRAHRGPEPRPRLVGGGHRALVVGLSLSQGASAHTPPRPAIGRARSVRVDAG